MTSTFLEDPAVLESDTTASRIRLQLLSNSHAPGKHTCTAAVHVAVCRRVQIPHVGADVTQRLCHLLRVAANVAL